MRWRTRTVRAQVLHGATWPSRSRCNPCRCLSSWAVIAARARRPGRPARARWRPGSLSPARGLSAHREHPDLRRQRRAEPSHPGLRPLCRDGLREATSACPSVLVVLCAACSATGPEHLTRARELVYARKPQAALREYRLALDAVERSDGPEAARIRAAALRGAADVYWLELHDVPKAVSVYRELVTQAPDAPETAEAHVVLAGILESQYRDLRGAISEITAALARDPPTAPDLRYQVAKLYFELGDYQQAELEARTLIQKFPCEPAGRRRVDARRAVALHARRDARRGDDRVLHPGGAVPRLRARPACAVRAGQAPRRGGRRRGSHPGLGAGAGASPRSPGGAERDRPDAQADCPDHPARNGYSAQAFQRPEPLRVSQARTSLEAAGGTAEQAAREHGD